MDKPPVLRFFCLFFAVFEKKTRKNLELSNLLHIFVLTKATLTIIPLPKRGVLCRWLFGSLMNNIIR